MRRVIAACLIAGALTLAGAIPAQGQSVTTLTGTIRNATANVEFDPASVRVSLTILDGIVSIDQRTQFADADGRFAFGDVPVATGRTYFVTAEYGGAVYSVSLQVSNLGMPVNIEVFESTNSSDVLRISDYSVIVTGANRDGRVLEILERASVHNDSDRTLVPDLQGEGPAMLSFLRFALPRGATHLDVRSNLVGGDVLEVDRGFAVSVPVPPTPQDQPHRFEFVYRLTYDGAAVDLSRTLRFGAESLRFVVPTDTGTGVAPELADLGVADLTGRRLQLLEGAAFAPGDPAELRVVGLPQPTLLSRIGSASGRAYLAYALPSAVGAALLALLLIGARRGSARLKTIREE